MFFQKKLKTVLNTKQNLIHGKSIKRQQMEFKNYMTCIL